MNLSLSTLPETYHVYDSKAILTNIFIFIPVLYILYKQPKSTLSYILALHITCIAIMSTYYHMKPNDDRLTYDMLSVATTTALVYIIVYPSTYSWLLYLVSIITVVLWRKTQSLLLYSLFIIGTPLYIGYTYYNSKYNVNDYILLIIGTLCLLRLLDRATIEYHIFDISNHSWKHILSGIHILLVIVFLQKIKKI
jgi:hypothetical protein